jgi:hypothetical protein
VPIYTTRGFVVVISIFTAALIVDLSLGNVISAGNTSLPSNESVPVFIILAVTYVIVQYLILEYTKKRGKQFLSNYPHVNLLNKAVAWIQYVFAAFILILVLQITVSKNFSPQWLFWSNTVTYLLASSIAAILAQKFFLWYKYNKSFVVLLYGLTFVTLVSSLVLQFVYSDVSILKLTPVINTQSKAVIPFYDLNTPMGIVQYVTAISNAVNYFLLWISTVTLLRHYSQKIGQVKFWTIMVIPLVSVAYQYVIASPVTQVLQGVSHADENSVLVAVFGNTIPGIAFGIIFGIPFWMVSKSMRHTGLRDYLIMAGFGLIILQISTSAGVYAGPYPPLGLFSVLATVISTYLILIGLYYTAVCISQDSTLRRSIRSLALEESKMLGNIGDAHMEQDLQTKVLSITKRKSHLMVEESGIEPTLSDDDVRQYMEEVLEQIRSNNADNVTEH